MPNAAGLKVKGQPHLTMRRLTCRRPVRSWVAAEVTPRAAGVRAMLLRVSSDGSATEKVNVCDWLPSTVARTMPAPSCAGESLSLR